VTNITWLGGRGSDPVDARVRGARCIEVATAKQEVTLAEALLGLTAALSSMLGGDTLSLRAIDNGSGKLIETYRGCDFETCGPSDEDSPHMQAPAKAVAKLAPIAWTEDLLPRNFNPRTWFCDQIARLWMDPQRPAALPWWSFFPDCPENVRVEVKLCMSGSQAMLVTVTLCSKQSYGTANNLVYCRSALHLDSRLVSVLWLGRSRLRTVSSALRGRATCCISSSTAGGHAALCLRDRDSGNDCLMGSVTCAVAVLGLVAAVAHWFGLVSFCVRAHDNGSGKLVQYLKQFGFVQAFDGSNSRAADLDCAWLRFVNGLLIRCCRPKLWSTCEEVARRCCPVDWRKRVVREEEETMTLARVRQLHESRADLIDCELCMRA